MRWARARAARWRDAARRVGRCRGRAPRSSWERLVDALAHVIERSVRIDDDESIGLRFRQRQIAFAHAPIEAQVLRFEAQFIAAATARAAQPGLFIDVEQ